MQPLFFGLQTLSLKDFSKIFGLKGLKPKNKDHTNFYECWDLMEKVYLEYILDNFPNSIVTSECSPGTKSGKMYGGSVFITRAVYGLSGKEQPIFKIFSRGKYFLNIQQHLLLFLKM